MVRAPNGQDGNLSGLRPNHLRLPEANQENKIGGLPGSITRRKETMTPLVTQIRPRSSPDRLPSDAPMIRTERAKRQIQKWQCSILALAEQIRQLRARKDKP